MRLADATRWFFALPDPAVDRSAMTRVELMNERHRRRMRTPFGRAIIRFRLLQRSIPRRVHALVWILWRATAGRWLWIKRTNFAETEVAAMRYVANHTDIPVPRVWYSFKWRNRAYIVMDRVPGITLFDALHGGYLQDGDKQDALAAQLARHMAQLRSLAPPPGLGISSVLGGPVRCPRLFQDPLYGPTAPPPPTGPFKSEATMNLQLRHLRSLEACAPIVVAAHSTAHPLLLTHSDLVPRNIMVDYAVGKVVAIIDWEYAGWFPAHWEICMMTNWEQESVG
ncbi:kinase-like domain-containing protein, partial [Mycena filopes]